MSKATVAQMTQDELKVMLGDLIDQKLTEMFGDPDEGLVVRKALRERLARQKTAVANGELGRSSPEVKKRLGLA